MPTEAQTKVSLQKVTYWLGRQGEEAGRQSCLGIVQDALTPCAQDGAMAMESLLLSLTTWFLLPLLLLSEVSASSPPLVSSPLQACGCEQEEKREM